jgi:hypothetical protein
MRGEITSMGINPIQVFGFSRQPIKNAADFQLVIDAIHLANLHASIEVFVIVSGDGGFAALAKKLHEYGKTVIGCAYPGSTSQILQAICDDFVWINDPLEKFRQASGIPAGGMTSGVGTSAIAKPPNGKALESPSEDDVLEEDASLVRPIDLPVPPVPPPNPLQNGLDPRNARLVLQLGQKSATSPTETLAQTLEILNWYANDPVCQPELRSAGLHLSVVKQAVSQVLPNLQTIPLGFPKFVEYMQHVCKDTPFCMISIPPSLVKLALRDSIPSGYEVLPDLASREVHAVETYRSILSAGAPLYRLPESRELWAIATWLIQHPIQETDLETLLADLETRFQSTTPPDQKIPPEIVKLALYCFLSGGLFIREPEGVPTIDQKLTLRPEVTTAAIMMTRLKEAVRQKLATALTQVDETVLQQIISDKPS